ncbi:Na/Pi cotransporter family protein [Alkalihalobacillus pseudalcaliphilus]|uniref:Na/Pi cotransporter family protein n=1 Tax=Alkalihalobacillus pseudalcaliphilus TaxID=79884 RepID=UPI00064DBF47|nr:Na/Pi cotransporter family protein [Alkalihalobacillus pseudalcaliphilus]KMK77382.1 hypothetical protein AB990_02570 [Alkalihalobacillus pseudalcaliphilus]
MVWPMVIGIVGGIAIFLYGMYIASEGLKKSASNHLKKFLTKVTKNQFYGAVVGILLAAVLQSSSAATVMVVGFVNARLLTLRQAMGIMLGSAVGTTLTVQLIAFRLTDYALLFVALGVGVFLLGKEKVRALGSVLLGFGFVFYGMGMITAAMEPVQNNPELTSTFVYLTDNLYVTVFIALIFTAIIQNSAATIAIAMTLSASGSLSMEAAVAIVYGANIGTVVTALISSISASKDAQRTAVAHALFKVIGVLLFLPFTHYFVVWLELFSGGIERQVANAHTIFNIINLVVLLPFCSKFADWMLVILPAKEKAENHVQFLDKESLEVPTIALVQAKKELGHMAESIRVNMLSDFDKLLYQENLSHRQAVIRHEDRIDATYKSIYHYLQKITQKDLSDEESEESLKYLYINNHLEGISDAIYHIALTTGKLEVAQVQLQDWERQGISQLFEEVLTSYEKAIQAFEFVDKQQAIAVINRNPIILRKEKELRFQHFHSGTNQSSRLSSVYVDIMNELIMVNHHVVNISYTVNNMV